MISLFAKSKDSTIASPEKLNKKLEADKIAEQKKAEISEYNAIKSKCLSCKNAFWQQYVDNPHNPDPLTLVCRNRLELKDKLQLNYISDVYECLDDRWYRKVLSCSDYEEKEISHENPNG